jgi:hypothetical protein
MTGSSLTPIMDCRLPIRPDFPQAVRWCHSSGDFHWRDPGHSAHGSDYADAPDSTAPQLQTTYDWRALSDTPISHTLSRFATTLRSAKSVEGLLMARFFAGYGVMRAGPGAVRSLFVAGTILAAAHVTLLVFDRHALFLSNLFNIMYPLLGGTVCLLGVYSKSPETRPLWLLFGCGLLVAAVGEIGLTYHDFGTHIRTETHANNSDFFFFAYAIPVLLAICSRTTDAGLKSFAWLDGAQALIATMLAYCSSSPYCPLMPAPRPYPRPILRI